MHYRIGQVLIILLSLYLTLPERTIALLPTQAEINPILHQIETFSIPRYIDHVFFGG